MKRFVLFTAVLAISLLLLGCAGSAPEPQKGAPSASNQAPQAGIQVAPQKISPDSIADPELRQIYLNSQVPAPPKATVENVKASFYSGKLAKADYITLLYQSLFAPESTPQEYKGEPVSDYDISREWMLAIESWDELSEQQKQTILPWISIWGDVPQVASDYAPANKPEVRVVSLDTPVVPSQQTLSLSPAKRNSETSSSAQKKISLAGPMYIEYALTAIPGKVSIRERILENHTQAEKDALDARLSMLKRGALDAYPKFKSLMGIEPSQEIYVYVEPLKPGIRGSAAMFAITGDPIERCRVIVDMNQTQTEAKSKDTLAHELFHCFQYQIPLRNFADPDESWITEATAVWSENYVYPSANFEHERLPVFFTTRHEPLVQNGSLKEYADYPFFLFLEQYSDTDNIVQALKDAKTKRAKGALKAIPNYDNILAEYSVWNWNMDPVKNYQDDPNFPPLKIQGPAVVYNYLPADAQLDIPYEIQPGSAHYSALDIPQDAKKIKFTFPQASDPKRQRTALIKISGIWHDEDWSGLSEKIFCLERPDEKVQAIVIVLSNSDLDSKFTSTYSVDTEGECQRQIGGTTKVSWNFQVQGKSIRATYTQADTLQYDSEEERYVLKSRTMGCTYSDTTSIDDEVMPMHGSMTGSGSSTEEYPDPSVAPLKMRLKPESNRIDFKVDPDKKNSNWVHYSGSMNGVAFQEDGDCGSVAPMPGYVELEMDKYLTGDRLHGQESLSNGAITTNIEFDYIIPEPEIRQEEE